MPPPNAVVCKICGGKFMAHSYPIHLPRCQKKFDASHTKCEHCGRQINNCDWGQHRSDCKPIKRARRKKRKEPVIPKGPIKIDGLCEECETSNATLFCHECEMKYCDVCSKSIHSKGARKRHTIRNSSGLDPAKEHDQVTTEDGDVVQREACNVCGRKFAVDRIYIHERICIKKKEKERKIKPKTGAKLRIQGTDFERYVKKRPETPPEVVEWRKHGRRWRQERQDFKSVVEEQNMRAGILPTEEKLPASIVEEPKNIILPRNNVDISRRGLLRATPDAFNITEQLKKAVETFSPQANEKKQRQYMPSKNEKQENNNKVISSNKQAEFVQSNNSSKKSRSQQSLSKHSHSQQSLSKKVKAESHRTAPQARNVSTLKGSVSTKTSKVSSSNRAIKGKDGSIKIRSQYQDRALARKRGEDAMNRLKQSKKQSRTLPLKKQSKGYKLQSAQSRTNAVSPSRTRDAREAFLKRQEAMLSQQTNIENQQQLKQQMNQVVQSNLKQSNSNEEVLHPERKSLPKKKLSSMEEYLERERLRRSSNNQNTRNLNRKSPSYETTTTNSTIYANTNVKNNETELTNHRNRIQIVDKQETNAGAAFTIETGKKGNIKAMPTFSSKFRAKKEPKKQLPGLLGKNKKEALTIAERDNPNVGKVPVHRMLKAKMVDGKVQRILDHNANKERKTHGDILREQRMQFQ